MSEQRDKHESNEDLEALLRNLVPAPLQFDHVADLRRERELFEMARSQSPTQVQWGRLVPLMLVCTVVMFGAALFRYGDRLRGANESEPKETIVQTETPAAIPDRFVPVSTHGTILKTSSGGVVETEAGPRERLNIEYQDAYHWHDPESGTNIRLFRPRSEEVIVPLPKD